MTTSTIGQDQNEALSKCHQDKDKNTQGQGVTYLLHIIILTSQSKWKLDLTTKSRKKFLPTKHKCTTNKDQS